MKNAKKQTVKNNTNVKVSEIITVNIEAPTEVKTLAQHATRYKATLRASKARLEILADIGNALLDLKNDYLLDGQFRKDGKQAFSTKKFGAAVAASPLKIMSKDDRANAIWLSENWTFIEAFKRTNDCASQSVSYLRKMVIAAEKLANKPDAADAVEVDDKKVVSFEASTETSAQAATMSDTELVAHMLELVKSNGLNAKAIATMFKNAAKTA